MKPKNYRSITDAYLGASGQNIHRYVDHYGQTCFVRLTSAEAKAWRARGVDLH